VVIIKYKGVYLFHNKAGLTTLGSTAGQGCRVSEVKNRKNSLKQLKNRRDFGRKKNENPEKTGTLTPLLQVNNKHFSIG